MQRPKTPENFELFDKLFDSAPRPEVELAADTVPKDGLVSVVKNRLHGNMLAVTSSYIIWKKEEAFYVFCASTSGSINDIYYGFSKTYKLVDGLPSVEEFGVSTTEGFESMPYEVLKIFLFNLDLF